MVSAVGFGVGAVAAGAAILRFEADNALQNGPSYIKDGVPTSAPAQIGQAIARQACRRYADGVDSLLDEAAVNFEVVCRPYLDNIGYGQGPSLELPFRGGQCYVGYQFKFTATDLQGNRTTTQQGTGGRLIGAEVQFQSNGNPVGGYLRQLNPTAPVEFVGIQVNNPGVDVNPVITDVVRNDGLPDDCGNPPVDFTEPVPPPTPGPPTEPFNPGPDIDIDITVEVKPDALIEVNLGFGPIIINPFGGGGDGGGEPGVDPDTSPPAPDPGPELPGGNGGFGGDDEFGPPPAGRRWVGCCIRITDKPENAGIIVGSEPEDVYPSVIGNIRLVFNASGNRQTDTPIRILAKHVCVWEPVSKLNPTGVNVDLLPGYGYTFTPYSVPSGD